VILREHQISAIQKTRDAYQAGRRRVVLTMPTGSGKTVTAGEICRLALQKEQRVLFVVPLLELLGQAVSTLRAVGIQDIRTIQADNDEGSADARMIVASIQTLASKRRFDSPIPADFLVVDECFPAGTLVDGRPIEAIRVGDLVRSLNHDTQQIEMRTVRRLFCSHPQSLVTIHLSNGQAIRSTAGHPFFDGTDYTAAVRLKPGSAVYGASVHMRGVFDDVRASDVEQVHGSDLQQQLQTRTARETAKKDNDAVSRVRCDGDVCREGTLSGRVARASVLLEGLQLGISSAHQFGPDGGDESQARSEAHEGTQPHALCGRAIESQPHSQANRTPPAYAGREWTRTGSDGNALTQRSSAGMAAEYGRAYGTAREWRSESLQDRHRQPGSQDCDRSGRRQPWNAQSQREGRPQADLSRIAWVDRVEVHQPRGSDGFGALCPDDLVYNIEVDGNHNYFVNDVLVHNCHHGKARTHERFLSLYQETKILGLTATCQRGDGQALGDVYDALVVGSTVKELTDLKLLVPCKVYAPPRILNSRELAQDPVDAYEQRTPGKKAIVFCSSVQQAEATAQQFNARGHQARWVSG
jgi:hypothetical protein